jgi:BioD-like phosphotransacetylase family protein
LLIHLHDEARLGSRVADEEALVARSEARNSRRTADPIDLSRASLERFLFECVGLVKSEAVVDEHSGRKGEIAKSINSQIIHVFAASGSDRHNLMIKKAKRLAQELNLLRSGEQGCSKDFRRWR